MNISIFTYVILGRGLEALLAFVLNLVFHLCFHVCCWVLKCIPDRFHIQFRTYMPWFLSFRMGLEHNKLLHFLLRTPSEPPEDTVCCDFKYAP